MQPTTTTTTEDPAMMSPHDHLEQLASELIGDGKSPNLYFVTEAGRVQTITTDRRTAYLHWRQLAARRPRVECSLEDRESGVLCAVERDEAGRLEARDDYGRLTGDAGATVRQTTCRHCGLDIEGMAPFERTTWRDRGRNSHCPSGAEHAPVPEV